MKSNIVKIAIGAGILTAMGVAPIVPNDIPYLYSCEVVAFDTPTGELGENQYAMTETGRYIVKNDSDISNCSPVTQLETLDTTQMEQVALDGFKTYSGFLKSDNTVNRIAPFEKYQEKKKLVDYVVPESKEYKSIIGEIAHPNQVDAAIAKDSVSSTTCSTCTSLSWTHVTTGSNTTLAVFAGIFDDTSAAERNIASITYNSLALTAYASSTEGNIQTEIWYRVAPSTGSNTVLITAGGTNDFISGISATYTGVNQSVPFEVKNVATGFGQNASVSCTTVTPNDWVLDAMIKYDTTELMTIGAGQVYNASTTVGSGFGIRSSSSYKTTTTPGATSLSWTWSTTDRDWALACVGLREAVSNTNGTLLLFL